MYMTLKLNFAEGRTVTAKTCNLSCATTRPSAYLLVSPIPDYNKLPPSSCQLQSFAVGNVTSLNYIVTGASDAFMLP